MSATGAKLKILGIGAGLVFLAACSSSGSDPTPMPSGFPTEVPAPPASVLKGNNDFTGDNAAGTAIGASYTSTDSLAEINEFYQKILSENGWYIVATMPSDDESVQGQILTAQNGPGTQPSDSPLDIVVITSQQEPSDDVLVTVNYSG